MKNSNLDLEALKEGQYQLEDLPANFFHGLSERLERLLSSGHHAALEAVTEKIGVALKKLYASAEPETRAALREKTPGPIYQAYRLGQFSFAQALASKAAEKRVDTEFVRAIQSGKFKAIIEALWDQELNGVDLASAVNESKEGVSRKLSEMRKLGISLCWKDGKEVYNYLSPATRALFPEQQKPEHEHHEPAEQQQIHAASEILESMNAKLDPAQQRTPSFARRRIV